MSLFTKLFLIFLALFIIALVLNVLVIKFYYWGSRNEPPKKSDKPE